MDRSTGLPEETAEELAYAMSFDAMWCLHNTRRIDRRGGLEEKHEELRQAMRQKHSRKMKNQKSKMKHCIASHHSPPFNDG